MGSALFSIDGHADYKEAANAFEKAVALIDTVAAGAASAAGHTSNSSFVASPNTLAEALSNWGSALLAAGDVAKAVEVLEKASAAIESVRNATHEVVVGVAGERGGEDEGEGEGEGEGGGSSAKSGPVSDVNLAAMIAYNLGSAQAASGDAAVLGASVGSFERAIDLSSTPFTAAHLNLGASLNRLRRYDLPNATPTPSARHQPTALRQPTSAHFRPTSGPGA